MPPPTRSLSTDVKRVLLRLLAFGLLSVALIVAVGMVLKPAFPSGLPFGRAGKVLYFLIVGLSLGLSHLAAAFWEKSGDWAVLGFAPEGWHPRRIGFALLAGVGVVVLPALLFLGIGIARIQPMADGGWLGYALDVLVVSALATLTDAMAFRGYLHGLLERRWGAWVAVGVTTLLFTLVHAFGTPMSAMHLLAMIALGTFLGAVRARSEGVAASWAAHFAIFWAQGALLHSGVSLLDLEAPPIYRMVLGPPWFVTGAGWGVDGGLAVAVLLFAAAWFLMRPLPLVPPPPARP